ncbi:MAG: hypothetical protein JNL01_13615 [Bdellovibrionales bacterium]|nr:hypothetical protein [Bdellovibrionales bacterium]
MQIATVSWVLGWFLVCAHAQRGALPTVTQWQQQGGVAPSPLKVENAPAISAIRPMTLYVQTRGWVPMHVAPDDAAKVVGEFGFAAQLPVVEEKPDWVGIQLNPHEWAGTGAKEKAPMVYVRRLFLQAEKPILNAGEKPHEYLRRWVEPRLMKSDELEILNGPSLVSKLKMEVIAREKYEAARKLAQPATSPRDIGTVIEGFPIFSGDGKSLITIGKSGFEVYQISGAGKFKPVFKANFKNWHPQEQEKGFWYEGAFYFRISRTPFQGSLRVSM